MNQLVTLRVLLSIQLLAAALSISLDQAGHFAMTGAMGEAQAALQSADLDASNWLAMALLPALLASMIGIWRGRLWGRNLYTMAMTIGLLMVGSSVLHPVESLLDTVETLSNGAMLALMWLTPTKVQTATSRRHDERAEYGVIDAM